MELLDFSTGSEFFNNFFESMSYAEKFDEAIENNDLGEQETNEHQFTQEDSLNIHDDPEIDAMEYLFNAFTTFMPDAYNEMLAARIYPFRDAGDEKLWALLQEENLESSPVELLSKYQQNVIPNCTVLARVDTITAEKPQSKVPNRTVEELDFGTLSHLTDDLAVEFGFKVNHPSIAISPIAIYR